MNVWKNTPEDGCLRLCAHRGLSRACPENTLPALAAAAAVGAHEVEFDLWMSSDGVPVVCHDPGVDRTTDGTGRITDMSWDDIRRLDAGVRLGEAWKGTRVPRLEQVLNALPRSVALNIHIKEAGPGAGLVRLVCDLLAAHDWTDAAYLAAGDEQVLSAARGHAPRLARAWLFSEDDPVRHITTAIALGCSRIQFGRGVNMTPEHFRTAHEAGITCNLYYSDDAAEARDRVRGGVDVILTNCAHQLMQPPS